jgi:hypothetical protein
MAEYALQDRGSSRARGRQGIGLLARAVDKLGNGTPREEVWGELVCAQHPLEDAGNTSDAVLQPLLSVHGPLAH